MDSKFDSLFDQETVEIEDFPDGLMGGSTVLLTGDIDPSTYAIGLRALCQYGNSNESSCG